jgi:hypothetical protein
MSLLPPTFLDHFDKPRVFESLSSFFFTLEAFKQDRICFDLRVRDFDGDNIVRQQVGGFERRRAAIMGDHIVKPEVIQLIATLGGRRILIFQVIHRYLRFGHH